ncbi:hypothetical protein BC936DRAFT_136821 [Jimgerdemannia flammicorona]|uniref:DSBA-like thioredoxin domain-containing protein n=1 Tax=Jimgerdemannia flammicorona TaxID=994334 RepID=A0A433CYQ4_9FUNG|nr:hypothetical protein BC936DRAFT_136821 [Jimgerdemannia flammicorona]
MLLTKHLFRTMTTAIPSKVVTIDIVSDTICPWCFVGKRRLETAIAQAIKAHPGTKFETVWHPYELDPTLPKESVDKHANYVKKFGEERMKQMLPYMENIGKAENISFNFGGRVGNTTDSHRLVWWATKQGKQDEMVEELFRHYFEQERDVADVETLAEIARKVGLDRNATLAFLQSDEGRAEVKAEIYRNMGKSISGVPHFMIDKRYTLSGAQPPETFVELFDEILA